MQQHWHIIEEAQGGGNLRCKLGERFAKMGNALDAHIYDTVLSAIGELVMYEKRRKNNPTKRDLKFVHPLLAGQARRGYADSCTACIRALIQAAVATTTTTQNGL